MLCLFDEYNGLESELLCEKIFVLEKRGEEGLIVWRKEFAIYIFFCFAICLMTKYFIITIMSGRAICLHCL